MLEVLEQSCRVRAAVGLIKVCKQQAGVPRRDKNCMLKDGRTIQVLHPPHNCSHAQVAEVSALSNPGLSIGEEDIDALHLVPGKLLFVIAPSMNATIPRQH